MALQGSSQAVAAPAWRRAAKAYGPLLAGILFTVIGVAMLARKIWLPPAWPDVTDLRTYLEAAAAITSGAQPYDHHFYKYDPYGYPPLFAMLIAVLRFALGTGHGWFIWVAASIASIFTFCAMIMRGFGTKLAWGWVALAGGLIIFGHIGRSELYHGQPTFFLVSLFVFGLMQFRARREWLGALAWSAVIVCKPFLGVMVLFLLRRGEWSSLFKTLGASFVLFAAPFLLFGAKALNAFTSWLAMSHWYTTLPNVAKPGNQTLYGLGMRLFSSNIYSTGWVNAPVLATALMAAVLPLIGLGLYWSTDTAPQAAGRDATEAGGEDLLQAALPLGFFFAYGPLTEAPHMFLLLPALMGCGIILARRTQTKSPSVRWWRYAFAAWCLEMLMYTIPVALLYVSPSQWHRLSGLGILLSFNYGLTTLAACVLSVIALQADRKLAARTQRVAA